MSLTRDAIDRIVELTQAADGKTVTIDGVEYTTASTYDPRKPAPTAEALQLRTLTGLVQYLQVNVDGLDAAHHLIHVVSPTEVWLRSRLSDDFRRRENPIYLHAHITELQLGQFYRQEGFLLSLLTGCTDAGDRAKILKLAGNLTDENIMTLVDDGVTQQVTAKSGVSVVGRADVPNPVQLAPYRTFTDVEQVLSPFVLRVRKSSEGPQLALFEADGGAWRQTAMERVQKFLIKYVPAGWNVIA